MSTNTPLTQKYRKGLTSLTLKVQDEIYKILNELCPAKNEEEEDLPVVACSGILGLDMGPEDRYKVKEFTGGAMYVQNFRDSPQQFTTELWDFFWDVEAWLMLLCYLEQYKENPEQSVIRTVERRQINNEYKVYKNEQIRKVKS